jgi:hypothetical protein
MTIQTSPFIKEHTHQLLDQFSSDRLPEISLFLEQLLKVVNSVNQSTLPNSLQEENPWIKFSGMFADDPDWEEFQVAIAENRRELDAMEGI